MRTTWKSHWRTACLMLGMASWGFPPCRWQYLCKRIPSMLIRFWSSIAFRWPVSSAFDTASPEALQLPLLGSCFLKKSMTVWGTSSTNWTGEKIVIGGLGIPRKGKFSLSSPSSPTAAASNLARNSLPQSFTSSSLVTCQKRFVRPFALGGSLTAANMAPALAAALALGGGPPLGPFPFPLPLPGARGFGCSICSNGCSVCNSATARSSDCSCCVGLGSC
mmetsp:Transcript_37193/g.59920  ORF Transcript_37193/g.59920 Transcript_37193/m.59920 type:complete len:220 (-) Transcript_37193:478-1137(-)